MISIRAATFTVSPRDSSPKKLCCKANSPIIKSGETTRYGLYNTQERGQLFVGPQTQVYEGMIVGENPKNDDIAVNPCQKKQLTAIRSAGADEKLLLTPAKIFTLE